MTKRDRLLSAFQESFDLDHETNRCRSDPAWTSVGHMISLAALKRNSISAGEERHYRIENVEQTVFVISKYVDDTRS